MTARLKGRRCQAELVIAAVTRWAMGQPDVSALALVGSDARRRPWMGSDVDLVLLAGAMDRHTDGIDWAYSMAPGLG